MELTRLLILAAAALTASACFDDDNENHGTSVVSPAGMIYADQNTDTLIIGSWDSYNATIDCDWIYPKTGFHFEANDSTLYRMWPLTITPNTTGKMKKATLSVISTWQPFSGVFQQTAWVNVTSPRPVYYEKDQPLPENMHYNNLEDVTAKFLIEKGKDEPGDRIQFALFDEMARISADSWIKLDRDSVARKKPYTHKSDTLTVNFTLNANNTGADRTGAIVILTQNGVRTEISVKQRAR